MTTRNFSGSVGGSVGGKVGSVGGSVVTVGWVTSVGSVLWVVWVASVGAGSPNRTQPQSIAATMLTDKKRFADTVNLIVPNAIGNCTIYPTPIQELESFLKAGM